MRVLPLAAIAALTLAAPLAAQVNTTDKVEITRDQIMAEKRAIVAQNMNLSEQESVAFWPVYDEFQAELRANTQKAGSFVADNATSWGSLSAEQSEKLVKGVLGADKERLELFQKYWGKFTKVITPAQTARYYQIERKLKAILDVALADAIPLVGPPSGS